MDCLPDDTGHQLREVTGIVTGRGVQSELHMDNLFANLPTSLPNEIVETLVNNRSMRIERIVSTGQCSPKDAWYDQDQHEWVVVLKGEATLQIEGQPKPLTLCSGDYVNLPAHRRHRVASTSPTEVTVWLAVFYD